MDKAISSQQLVFCDVTIVYVLLYRQYHSASKRARKIIHRHWGKPRVPFHCCIVKVVAFMLK